MNLMERVFKKKPDGFKRQTILNQCKEVDEHNYNVRRRSQKYREDLSKEIMKDITPTIYGNFKAPVRYPKKPFFQRFKLWLKKQIDIKKGDYSPRQKYVNGKWEYIK